MRVRGGRVVLSFCLGVLGVPAVCALGLFVGCSFPFHRNSMRGLWEVLAFHVLDVPAFQDGALLPFTPDAWLHKVGSSYYHRAFCMLRTSVKLQWDALAFRIWTCLPLMSDRTCLSCLYAPADAPSFIVIFPASQTW